MIVNLSKIILRGNFTHHQIFRGLTVETSYVYSIQVKSLNDDNMHKSYNLYTLYIYIYISYGILSGE